MKRIISLSLDVKVVWFNTEMWDGLDTSKAYVFGGRSFSVYEVTANGLNLVYDSGSGFEEITAAQLPDYFNASNDKTSLDNRSGKKGPEPEPEPEPPVIPVIPSYGVTLPADLTGGTVTLNRTYAIAGSTVTITVTPEEGFALESLTVTDAKGSQLTLTDLGEGKYSFRMPSGKVTVTAEFAEIEQPMENPFEDVTAEDYYYDAVLWAVKQGITEGDGDSTFSPEKTCTRAEIVTFLWRAAGSPEPKTQDLTFTDVSQDEYYCKAVLWALENGITLGTGDTTFSPEEPCTRAQGLTRLWRAMQAPEAAAADGFLDVAADAYYAEAVQWAVAQDVTNGTGPSTFSPDADCTRAQIVTFLWRAMGR